MMSFGFLGFVELLLHGIIHKRRGDVVMPTCHDAVVCREHGL